MVFRKSNRNSLFQSAKYYPIHRFRLRLKNTLDMFVLHRTGIRLKKAEIEELLGITLRQFATEILSQIPDNLKESWNLETYTAIWTVRNIQERDSIYSNKNTYDLGEAKGRDKERKRTKPFSLEESTEEMRHILRDLLHHSNWKPAIKQTRGKRITLNTNSVIDKLSKSEKFKRVLSLSTQPINRDSKGIRLSCLRIFLKNVIDTEFYELNMWELATLMCRMGYLVRDFDNIPYVFGLSNQLETLINRDFN